MTSITRRSGVPTFHGSSVPRIPRSRPRGVGIVLMLVLALAPAQGRAQSDAAPQRIISVVPAVTEMLFAIGAAPRVVGVSSFARFPPAVNALPRVGALLDPDVEGILSLRPDLVVLYGSQVDVVEQMTRARVRVFAYRHGGLTNIAGTMRRLGRETGHAEAANRAAASIEVAVTAVRARVAGRPRPRVLLVMGRDPDAIRNVYASGGRGFLHDMVVAAGGDNVFADIDREAVQPSSEGILAAAPDVVLEIRAEGLLAPAEAARQHDVWRPFSTIPAVRDRRVIVLTGNDLIVPGPRVAAATERLARALHPDAF